MKGVFIRGMKMPKSCLYCEFRKKIDQDNFRCKILGYPIDWRPCYIQERYTDCPLIEVEIDTDNNVGTTDVPDINVGDMISRQAAIDALRTCYDTETITMDNCDEYIHYGDAVGEIEQLPPIQPVIVPCDYAKACNEATMDKLTSAVAYYDVLEELRKHGYVLVDMRKGRS